MIKASDSGNHDSQDVILSANQSPTGTKADIRECVSALYASGVVEFEPELSQDGEVIYPKANAIMKLNGSKASEVLELLFKSKILSKRPTELSIKCPSCQESVVAVNVKCPNCGGTELMSGSTLQHLGCNYFGFESSFSRGEDGKFHCPKCERELYAAGSDYLTPGTFFKCNTCGEFTTKAKRVYSCPSCLQVFETSQDTPIETFKYTVNARQELHRVDLSGLTKRLEGAGLEVTADGSLAGRSGSSHNFSLVVKSPTLEGNEFGNTVLVCDTAAENNGADTDRIFALFAKSEDCGTDHRVLVASSVLSSQTRLLAKSFGIPVFELENTFDTDALLTHILAVFGKIRLDRKKTKRRNSIDIMADILSIVSVPSSKSEIISCANLSFEQSQKYLGLLSNMGLMRKYLEDGNRVRYAITERGREYMVGIAGEYGRIGDHKSVWSARREAGQSSDASSKQ